MTECGPGQIQICKSHRWRRSALTLVGVMPTHLMHTHTAEAIQVSLFLQVSYLPCARRQQVLRHAVSKQRKERSPEETAETKGALLPLTPASTPQEVEDFVLERFQQNLVRSLTDIDGSHSPFFDVCLHLGAFVCVCLSCHYRRLRQPCP